MATATETPQEALARIQGRGFGKNDAICIMAFADRGIDPECITPRENVLTFRARKAVGRQVAKGATGVSVTTWIPCKDSKKETKEGEERKGRLRPKTARLFHISQTIPTGAPKGTRPDAWQNPALVKAGTYEDDSPQQNRPLRPDITLSTGKVISHTRAVNGSQMARPAMTAAESDEYDNVAPTAVVRPEIADAFEMRELPNVVVREEVCTCPMAGVVTNVDCPIHGGR